MNLLEGQRPNYKFFALGALAFYLIVSLFMAKGMFSDAAMDGFYSQMRYAANLDNEMHALSWLHWLRLFIVLPFWFSHVAEVPDYVQQILILAYIAPILLVRIEGSIAYLRWLLLLLPFVLSFRACLCVVSITLLYLHVFHNLRSASLLLYSALLANLSSGVVIPWLLTVFVLFGRFKISRWAIGLAALVLVAGLSGSVMHKAQFFGATATATAPALETSPERAEGGFFYKILSRSTLYDSYSNDNLLKFYGYSVILVAYALAWLAALKIGLAETLFMGIPLPGFLMEGLWVTSYLGVALFFVIGVVLPKLMTRFLARRQVCPS